MNFIQEILEKENPTMEELLHCFEMVKRNGDVAVIKFDGLRAENEYTVFVAFSMSRDKETIRADESNLKIALIKVLNKYVNE